MTSFFPGDARSGGTQSLRVAVVGAGIAGLTAAYRLKQTGFEVVVLERQASVGGRMTLRIENNIEYNTGARLVYSFSKDLLTLMNQLGLTSDILPVEQTNTAIRCNGVDHPAHFTPVQASWHRPSSNCATSPHSCACRANCLVGRFTVIRTISQPVIYRTIRPWWST